MNTTTAGWCVRVSVFDDLVVSISERELAGRDLSEADDDLIRDCASHLLSFVGQKKAVPTQETGQPPSRFVAVDPVVGEGTDCLRAPKRFVLNQYGRQCFDLGYEAAKAHFQPRLLAQAAQLETVRQFVEAWREEADTEAKDRGPAWVGADAALRRCADELEHVLARVASLEAGAAPTGSSAEVQSGAVTAAERTEKEAILEFAGLVRAWVRSEWALHEFSQITVDEGRAFTAHAVALAQYLMPRLAQAMGQPPSTNAVDPHAQPQESRHRALNDSSTKTSTT